MGYVPGATDEYVIIGAHYDHLGLGEQYSLLLKRSARFIRGRMITRQAQRGSMALARYFASHPKPARGILFIAFAGEESGLLAQRIMSIILASR